MDKKSKIIFELIKAGVNSRSFSEVEVEYISLDATKILLAEEKVNYNSVVNILIKVTTRVTSSPVKTLIDFSDTSYWISRIVEIINKGNKTKDDFTS